MSKRFFIAGTGTGVGKTFVTTLLCKQLRARGDSLVALKPVISGYSESDDESDTAKILAACGLENTAQNIEKISPWRFAPPLSPDMAAAREGNILSLADITEFCRDVKNHAADITLIEGVGGVMVPLNAQHTTLDWIAQLAYPVILVGGTYLGAINHMLTSVQALVSRGVALHAVILSESEESPVTLAELRATLAHFLPKNLPVIMLPRHNKTHRLLDELSL